MTDNAEQTRSHAHEIEVDVPPEVVWRAITEASELTRWYVADATVQPGEGGSFQLSWGSGETAQSRVDVWDERRRLRLIEKSEVDSGPIVEEWTIDVRGGHTVLRIVHSGIPATADWDDFYHSTDHGWEMFLCTLRHYLHRHLGRSRRTLVASIDVARSDDTWRRLLDAVEIAGPDRYAAGELLAGQVLLRMPDRVLVLTIDRLDDAVLSIALEPTAKGTTVWAQLSAYGPATERLDEVEAPWRAWLDKVVC
ncbi:MAG TPA: SRPBCC domain-containing protein [Micromonosporaceae bacterium]|jgi:uncharacterized protein YndB with AHSA1/START domain|nr:SRPBCC domain-containing protein [Micromonosporaceae bacterium]